MARTDLWDAITEEADGVVDVLLCAVRCAMAEMEFDDEYARLEAATGRLSIGLVTLLVEADR